MSDTARDASPAGVASVPTVDAAAVPATHHPFRGAMAGVAVNCRECGTPWRGDAETGGCEAVLLARETIALRERAETAEATNAIQAELGVRLTHERRVAAERVALLEGLLRSVEWIDDHGPTPETDWCPACGWGRGEGHNPKCRLAVALADGG